eukprot:882111_1
MIHTNNVKASVSELDMKCITVHVKTIHISLIDHLCSHKCLIHQKRYEQPDSRSFQWIFLSEKHKSIKSERKRAMTFTSCSFCSIQYIAFHLSPFYSGDVITQHFHHTVLSSYSIVFCSMVSSFHLNFTCRYTFKTHPALVGTYNGVTDILEDVLGAFVVIVGRTEDVNDGVSLGTCDEVAIALDEVCIMGEIDDAFEDTLDAFVAIVGKKEVYSMVKHVDPQLVYSMAF